MSSASTTSTRRPASTGSGRIRAASSASQKPHDGLVAPLQGGPYVRVFGEPYGTVRLQGREQPGRLRPGLEDLGGGIGVAYERGAHPDPHPSPAVDVGGADEDGRVHGGTAVFITADESHDSAVVATPLRLVLVDDAARALQRTAGDRRREHRLVQDLAGIARAASLDEIFGVREPGHLLEIGAHHPAARVADPGHHLEFFVDDHIQLVGFLAVGEEVHHLRQRGAGRRVTVGAADGIHDSVAAREADVPLGRGTDERPAAGVDDERPVGARFPRMSRRKNDSALCGV